MGIAPELLTSPSAQTTTAVKKIHPALATKAEKALSTLIAVAIDLSTMKDLRKFNIEKAFIRSLRA